MDSSERSRRREVRRLGSRIAYIKVKLDRGAKSSPGYRNWDLLSSPNTQPLLGPSSRPNASPTRSVASQGAASMYHYLALTSPDSIRLLKALPSTLDDCIEIEIWEAHQSTPYRCLSYTWGDQSCQFPILLNGCTALVGANLLSFLEMAAQHFPGQVFWIDALCINQFDDDEKSVQVQRMGSIYENATDVLIWLGRHEGIEALFEWAGEPRSKTGQSMEHLPVKKMPRRLHSCVLDLAKHPYWRRAWVRQEMMLAKTIWLACGAVTIRPDVLFRCVNTSFFSSIDKVLVYGNLRQRLASLDPSRVETIPEYFWNVFKLSGETPDCSNPRDRIYSILTVTGQDKSFTVDYSEDVISFFWRSLRHFAPEADPSKVKRLWDSLELTPSAIEEAVEAKRGPLQFFIPMRKTKILPDIRRQLPWLFRLRRTGLCGHDAFSFARAQIQGYTRHDILLCPGTSNSNGLIKSGDEGYYIDLEGVHVLVHPLQPSGDRFTFTILNTTYGRLPQPEGTELWSKIDGIESRIQKWSEVTRVADLNEFSNFDDHEWKSRPHFMLKLSHLYFVECIKLMQEFWESKAQRSWGQQLDILEDDVLVSIGLKKEPSAWLRR